MASSALCIRITQDVYPVIPKGDEVFVKYSDLRSDAQTLRRGLGQYAGMNRSKDIQINKLQAELAKFANESGVDFPEKAKLLAILGKYRDVFAGMEQAGDDLVTAIDDYDTTARPYWGGVPTIGRLVAAVRRFKKAWMIAKSLAPQAKELEAMA